MVDVEFKIISIGEIKEAQMVRGTHRFDLVYTMSRDNVPCIADHLPLFFVSSKATFKPATFLNCHNYHHHNCYYHFFFMEDFIVKLSSFIKCNYEPNSLTCILCIKAEKKN